MDEANKRFSGTPGRKAWEAAFKAMGVESPRLNLPSAGDTAGGGGHSPAVAISAADAWFRRWAHTRLMRRLRIYELLRLANRWAPPKMLADAGG
jgi:hypothetical protein